MTPMVTVSRSDGPVCYLMDHGGKKVLPVFDNQREAKRFMDGWRIDGEQYYAGEASLLPRLRQVGLQERLKERPVVRDP